MNSATPVEQREANQIGYRILQQTIAAVALMWLVPDRRIERSLHADGG